MRLWWHGSVSCVCHEQQGRAVSVCLSRGQKYVNLKSQSTQLYIRKKILCKGKYFWSDILSFVSYLGFKGEVDESLPAPRLCKFAGVGCHFYPKLIGLVLYVYVKEQYGRQPKANVTHANSCFVSHLLSADKKWSGSQGNRVKGFCVLFFKHCMPSRFHFAWSLCCLDPSFFKLGVVPKLLKTTDVDSFDSYIVWAEFCL